MRHNLPSFPTPFIGRAEEITEFSQLLDNPDCRLLTLVGPGGIGKTRLSVEIARCKLGHFPDGVYFVPLQPLQTADQVLLAVINSLPLQATGDIQQGLLDYLRQKNLLLVLDNFEHVLEAVDLVNLMLASAPQVKLLVSSREVLRLQGEWVRKVDGLPYPDDSGASNLSDDSAFQLFAERAWRLNAAFSLVQEHSHVMRICRLVGGMPLALELAAGWTDTLPCSAIADEIARGLSILASDSRNLPDRHKNMRTVLDHSWQRLTDTEQAVFRKLCIFHGGFEREAAVVVAGASPSILSDLVRKSWLRMTGGRYDIQEVLRQYGMDQLSAVAEAEATHDGHCQYYAGFMQQRAPDVKGRRQLEALNEIESDWNNVRTAWGRALELKDWDAIGQSMEALHLFCDMHARYADGDTLFQAAVDALEPRADETRHPLWGELLVRAAEVLMLPELDKLVDRAVTLLDCAERDANLGDDPLYLWVRGRVLDILHNDPPNPDVLPLLEASLDGFRARDDSYYMARTLRSLAHIFARLIGTGSMDDTDKFIGYNQQYLDLTRAIGDETGMAHALFYQGGLASQIWSLDDTQCLWQEADRIWRRLGDWKSVAIIQNRFACIAFRLGDFDQAKSLFEGAVQRFNEVNYPDIRDWALGMLVAIDCLEGNHITGSQIRAGLPLLPNKPPPFGLLVAAICMGDFPSARDYLQNLLRWCTMHPVRAWYMVYLSHDYPEDLFPMAAVLLAHEGQLEWAVELLALQQATKHNLAESWLDGWTLLAQACVDLEQQLGAAAFDAAWQRGESLDVETMLTRLLTYLDRESLSTQAKINQALPNPLTERELEVLALLAQGLSNRQIAEAFTITVGTVKRYVYDICQKLHAQNRTHAVARARELGLFA